MNGQNDVAAPPEPLTRRRRSFVARQRDSQQTHTIAPLPVPDEEEEIPVLTEVVPLEDPLEDRIEQLASQMAQAICEQMAYELPTLIEASLINAGKELRDGVTSAMETALREFITRRKQLPLPLDEPDQRD